MTHHKHHTIYNTIAYSFTPTNINIIYTEHIQMISLYYLILLNICIVYTLKCMYI